MKINRYFGILHVRYYVLQVSRTPPDIQKKRQREEARKCQEEIAVLTLVPFAEQPIVSFENIKLGQSSVRKLAIRNPSSKSIQVHDYSI